MVDSLGNTSLRGERRVIKVREAIGTKGLLFMQIESKLPYDAILSKMFLFPSCFCIDYNVCCGMSYPSVKSYSSKR